MHWNAQIINIFYIDKIFENEAKTFYLSAFAASINLGTTSNASPTIP